MISAIFTGAEPSFPLPGFFASLNESIALVDKSEFIQHHESRGKHAADRMVSVKIFQLSDAVAPICIDTAQSTAQLGGL